MNSKIVHKVPLQILLVVSLLLTAACDLDTIADVKADPARYEEKKARIAGIVRQQYGVLGYGAYELEDQTGRIWVVSEGGGVPSMASIVEVEGTAQTAFSFSGVDFGTVIIESKRKVRR